MNIYPLPARMDKPKEAVKFSELFHRYTTIISGYLICISFGMMIGWTSPTYPNFLSPKSEIPINLDQSAMIAGMLMFGLILSTIISSFNCIDTNISLTMCPLLLSTGWLLIYFATSVLHLCISRFCVGFAAGICNNKFKSYICDKFKPKMCIIVAKTVPIIIGAGISASYIIGPFIHFRQFAKMAAVLPAISFVIFVLVFSLLKKRYQGENVVENISSKECVEAKGVSIINQRKTLRLIEVIKSKYNRECLLVLILTIFVQQFTGVPSLIVYNQVVFTEFKFKRPHVCSIVFILIYLLFTFIGVFCTSKFRRKCVLLISLIIATISNAINVFHLFYELEGTAILFITMLVYISFYSAGLSTIPSLVISDLFADNSKTVANCILQVFSALFSVIVTKLFQVLYSKYSMCVGFSLFGLASFLGVLLILILFEEPQD